MRRKLLLVLIVGFTLMSVSCTSSRTMVLNVPKEQIKAVSIGVMEEQGTVSVPPEVRNMFKDKLEKLLFIGEQDSPPPFTKGSDLYIHYRFIQFTAGSQLKRWLAGGIGGYGEGVITVEARFITSAGEEISKIQSEGKIGAGIIGGAIDGAVEKCAEEIVRYAKQNFS